MSRMAHLLERSEMPLRDAFTYPKNLSRTRLARSILEEYNKRLINDEDMFVSNERNWTILLWDLPSNAKSACYIFLSFSLPSSSSKALNDLKKKIIQCTSITYSNARIFACAPTLVIRGREERDDRSLSRPAKQVHV